MRPFAADTHAGLKRSQNEDCYEADPELDLWLVADGVGGHSCGEIASDIVRTTIRDEIAQGSKLVAAIEHSHGAILEEIEHTASTRGMGSTVVALLMDGDNYELAWVGDSRAYLWDTRLQQLSSDHNRVSELLANKIITSLEAARHPQRHVLTQSLGVSDKMMLQPGHQQGSLSAGQQILLCTDGLTDELSDIAIARLMAVKKTPQAQVDALIQAALDAGGSDNVTAVILGACATDPPRKVAEDLETTRNMPHSVSSDSGSGSGGFPFRAWLLVSIVALLLLWLIL